MLSEIFDRFVEKSPVTVMVRVRLERLLSPTPLDEWFERTAQKQYTRELLFSTVVNFNSEINTLGHPRAALFGFCLALVAYNLLAVVQAALRGVHGQEKVDNEVSTYYLAEELGATYRGMTMAIPSIEWQVFQERLPVYFPIQG